MKMDQRAFAAAYAHCCDAQTAAILCGCPITKAKSVGEALLQKKSVVRQIGKCFTQKLRLYDCVRTGLEKLAFGRSNDAVQLAFTEREQITGKLISSLDLSLVSSIKRDKDGGVDIKLFDRQKALEALCGLYEASDSEQTAQSFLSALSEGDEADEEV